MIARSQTSESIAPKPGIRRWGPGTSTLAAPTLALAIMLTLWGCKDATITLQSDPPGATVWLGETILGRTPLALPSTLSVPTTLRLSLPGCADTTLAYDPAKASAEGVLRVTMQRFDDLAIRCESTPTGADVYVDGEFRGRTPVDLHHLQRRAFEIVFMMANRKSVTRTIDLTTGKSPGTVQVQLPSLTEEYYRQQIKKNPTNLHHYCDLAHHFILEHRFDDAMTVFADAIAALIKNPSLPDSSRLWSEINRVVEEQYHYGNAAEVAQARKALRDGLGAILKAHPDAPFPYLYYNYILALDRLDQRQQAQDAFEEAWRRFPNNRVFQRLRREGFAIP